MYKFLNVRVSLICIEAMQKLQFHPSPKKSSVLRVSLGEELPTPSLNSNLYSRGQTA
jgi:hypothetical protein